MTHHNTHQQRFDNLLGIVDVDKAKLAIAKFAQIIRILIGVPTRYKVGVLVAITAFGLLVAWGNHNSANLTHTYTPTAAELKAARYQPVE